MKKNIIAILLAALVSISPQYLFMTTSDSPNISTAEMIGKLHEKIQSTPELENWQASVLTTLYEMDKNWEPKKKTIIEKLAVVKNRIRTEKILSATEYDGEKIEDKTAKYQVEAAKFNKRSASNKGKNEGRKGGRSRGMDLSQDDIFPLEEKRRKDYEFDLREGFLENEMRVYILESRSQLRSSDYYEGKYYIHPETFDILRAELRPAKNPGPLKLLEIRIDFGRTPEGYLVIRESKVRIHVGLIIKNIRMESEEIYSDYTVLE